MADNTVLPVGTGGDTIRNLADSGGVKWGAAVVSYATALGSPNTLAIPLAAALADAAANPTTLLTGACLHGFNGSTWDRLQVDASKFLKVDVAAGSVTANLGTLNGAALDTSVNGILVAQGSTTSGEKGPLVQGAVTTAAPSYTTAQTSPLSLDTSGNLRTIVTNTVTVSGSGTFTVSGTVTANLGTVAGLALDATVAKLNVAQGASLGSNTGPMVMGSVTTASPSYTTGQISPLSLDTSGSLRVAVVSGSTGNAAAGNTGSAVPAQADYGGLNVGGTLRGQTGANPTGTVYAAQTDLSSVGGTSVVLGQATMAASIPVVLASNQSAITVTANAGTNLNTSALALDTSVNGLLLGQGSTTSGEKGPLVLAAASTALPSLSSGNSYPLSLSLSGLLRVDGSQATQPVSGTLGATQSGTWTVQPGNTPNTTAWLTQPVSGTTGGATPYHLVSAASTNATSVKASAGTLYLAAGYNTVASARYLKLYDKASAPTVGTDTPKLVFMLPGNTAGAGFNVTFPTGVVFSTGIAFAITGGIADSDSTVVGASDCVVNLAYA